MKADVSASNAEKDHSRSLIVDVLADWKDEGRDPHEINNGSCFEFAEDVADRHPGRFMSVGIGDFMLYRGKWADEEYGFDEALLFHQWPTYRPLHDFTWAQMFSWGVFDWPGIHAWAHCRLTSLCFDAETPDGVRNPFELAYFAERWKLMERISSQGIDLRLDGEEIRRLPEDAEALVSQGWSRIRPDTGS